jgi:ABC-type xylose transport system permease subunit
MNKNALKKYSLLYSIIFLIIFLLSMITGGFNRRLSSPLSLHDMVKEIPWIAIFSLIMVYIYNRIKKK